MESPRSAKRRKVDATSTPEATSTPTNGTGRLSARRANASSAAKVNGTPLQVKATSATAPRPSNTTISARKSTGNDEMHVYDDFEGANGTPTVTRTSSTRAKSRLDASERRAISNQAAAHGLNSLRARLNARVAAEEKAKKAKADQLAASGASAQAVGGAEEATQQEQEEAAEEEEEDEASREGTPRSSTRPRKATAKVLQQEEEERKENERTKFEEEQYEKAIRRMAAKAKAAEMLQAKSKAGSVRGEGTPAKGRTATPKANGDSAVKRTATPKSTNVKKKGEESAKTIKVSAATPKSAAKQAVAEVAPALEEEVPEDTACKICGKLTSPKTNMMVVCDGCENAYHQKCHNPPIANRLIKDEDSEWFCVECVFRRGATTGATATVVPKRKAGRPPKPKPVVAIQRAVDVLDESEDEATPLSFTANDEHRPVTDKETPPQARELSPMILDLPSEPPPPRLPSQPATPAKSPVKTLLQPVAKPLQALSSADLSIAHDDLEALQYTVLEQVTGRRPNSLIGLDSEINQISNLVDQTISAGESNSLLVIGARGSGKSAAVESILRDQAQKQADAFHVVRLDGFIHTDDKIALREIWRQLGREMQSDDFEASAGKSYADALTTLLALLSHPSEFGQEMSEGLNGEHVKSKSVIFVIDEFDLFTTHPRQTLLYNLFDIAQSRKAPILVLGLTTRFDVAEQLEKRVKSRFSHRFVHLGLAKNFDLFKTMCQTCVSLEGARQNNTDVAISANAISAWTALMSDLFSTEEMHHHLRSIYYTTKSLPAFKSSLLVPLSTLLPLRSFPSPPNPHLHACPTLLQTLILSLSPTHPQLQEPDTKLPLLTSLSTLQLSLLIGAARLSIIHSTDVVSFALSYEEYKTLASRARISAGSASLSAAGASPFASKTSNNPAAGGMGTGGRGGGGGGINRVYSKPTARNAWEGLVSTGFIVAENASLTSSLSASTKTNAGKAGGGAGAGAGGGVGGMSKDSALFRVDVLLEEIAELGGRLEGMGGAMGRWCREI
ncbi:hypothetical protein AAFC00_004521 [Neodothiora populina]|uniref:PHD-type domain-containing protein n=1 Tax=Neodothiora populina TaxID=2781224 RepID=A0ABR3P2S8_9PEZI